MNELYSQAILTAIASNENAVAVVTIADSLANTDLSLIISMSAGDLERLVQERTHEFQERAQRAQYAAEDALAAAERSRDLTFKTATGAYEFTAIIADEVVAWAAGNTGYTAESLVAQQATQAAADLIQAAQQLGN